MHENGAAQQGAAPWCPAGWPGREVVEVPDGRWGSVRAVLGFGCQWRACGLGVEVTEVHVGGCVGVLEPAVFWRAGRYCAKRWWCSGPRPARMGRRRLPREARTSGAPVLRGGLFSTPKRDSVILLMRLGVGGDVHAGATSRHQFRVAYGPDLANLRQAHLARGTLRRVRAQGFQGLCGAARRR